MAAQGDRGAPGAREGEVPASESDSVCRFCLGAVAVDDVQNHIFDTRPLRFKIFSCLPLKICENDRLPKKICSFCILKIDDIYDYVQKAERSERELLSIHRNRMPYKPGPDDSIFVLEGIQTEIKREPPDVLDDYKETKDGGGWAITRCTQTEFGIFELKGNDSFSESNKDIKDEKPSNTEFQADEDCPYSSEDDLTLSDVIKIPPIKLKLKKEYSNGISTTKKLKKKKKVIKDADSKKIKTKKGIKKKSKKYADQEAIKIEDFHSDYDNPGVAFDDKVDLLNTANDVKQWQCLTCFTQLDSRADLLQHYKEHVENPEKFTPHNDESKCAIKTEIPKDANDSTLIENKYTIVESKTGKEFQCTKCFKSFSTRHALMRHAMSHDDSRPYLCNLCGRGYKRAYELLLHGRAHGGIKTLFCRYELCNYSTVYQGALMSHHKRHEPDFKYTCEICNKGFDVLTWFTEHKNVHTGDKPFSCDICGKCFIYSRYLTSHRKTVHPETSVRLQVHRCEECNLEFPYRKKLQRHRANVHRGEFSMQVLCDICGKSLSSREHLKFHRRIHTGEKPHICRTCGKGFVKKCNLTLHERVHSGERPHVCSSCGKAFSQRSTLVIHERYHSGARPYQCEHCKKGFVAKGLLSMHQKTCN